MSFFVTQKTLENLDWPSILARLEELARTPAGRARFAWSGESGAGQALFEANDRGVVDRLDETTEARSILVTGQVPPLGGIGALEPAIQRARKDGVLDPRELLEFATTLAATRAMRSFLDRPDEVPRLADLATTLVEHRDLEFDIESAIDRSGAIKDAASPTLASARAESRRLAAEIQSKANSYLSDPDLVSNLSDNYFTIRNDRFVLPVRADARTSVRGIVHDASNSGQTLFVEPEALVDLNNRHKRAEIAIEQEVRRILRELSKRAAAISDEIEANLNTLEVIDLAFARGGLAEEMDAICPEYGAEGVIRLPQLRHPLVVDNEVVPNDVVLGTDFNALVISGPNAGGKTVALKSIALAVLMVRAGLHVPAEFPARVDRMDAVLSDIGDEQDIREHLSTFSAHMANLAEIVTRSSRNTLVVLDEIGVGTDPGEGAALAQSVLESLAETGARVVTTTHYNLLKEMAEVTDGFANASVEFDPETLEPTYRLKMGLPGSSSATAVASRMGLPAEIIDRANELLEREDRQLDRVLSELATSRASIEAEQREIERIRSEATSVRDEHRAKLERLQQRRDKLFVSMREELEQSFRDAHEQVAQVIADLQRKGTAQQAARSRERLQQIATRNRSKQRESGLEPEAGESLNAIDWAKIKPGDAVAIENGGRGILLALPDKRGRVAVSLGNARVNVAADRVGRVDAVDPAQTTPTRPAPIRVTRAIGDSDSFRPAETDAGHVNLHGLRVEEAIDRLTEALDRALTADRISLWINHGVGTGALRQAVREYLRGSPYIQRYNSAPPNQGGEGVTIAEFV